MDIFNHYRELYKDNQNPIWIWMAISEYCQYYYVYSGSSDFVKETMEPPLPPEWIIDYLYDVSVAIVNINKPIKQGSAFIQKALGFSNAKQLSAIHKPIPEYEFEIFSAVMDALKVRENDSGMRTEFEIAADELEKKYNPDVYNKYYDENGSTDNLEDLEKLRLFKDSTVRNVYYKVHNFYKEQLNDESLLTEEDHEFLKKIDIAVKKLSAKKYS